MEDYNDTAAVAAEEAETASGEPDGSEKKHKRKLTAREKGKIALIVLGSFFGLIALLTVILAPIIVEGNKVITRDSAEPNDALTEWMSYISDDAPVTRLAIPGSHDSGCSGMPWYAETQDLNFAEQLARGVRYFDIRVNKKRRRSRHFPRPRERHGLRRTALSDRRVYGRASVGIPHTRLFAFQKRLRE